MRSFNKIFEIGSPKTDTSSLGRAFKILGLKHKGWDSYLHDKYKTGVYIEILETAQHYDAFEDGPWHALGMYRIFDKAFPNSKFILLERDLENLSWTQL